MPTRGEVRGSLVIRPSTCDLEPGPNDKWRLRCENLEAATALPARRFPYYYAAPADAFTPVRSPPVDDARYGPPTTYGRATPSDGKDVHYRQR